MWADGSGGLRHRDAVASDSTQTSAIDGISITPDNQILVELMPEDTTPANLFDLNGRTLVFTPDGRGGYSREVRSLEWEDAIGSEVTQEWEKFRDGIEVALGDFEFDYAGQRWDSFFVSKHGLITFGGLLEYLHIEKGTGQPLSSPADWLATTTTISALYKPQFGGLWTHDPLASQYVARWSDRVVVTWFASDVRDFWPGGVLPEQPERYQAVLYADGSIQFNYGHVTVRDGIVGLFPNEELQRGRLITGIADRTNRDLPGYLDLLNVAVYESNTDTLIIEWTLRDAVPTPPSGTSYSYRLYVDREEPYFAGDDDGEFMWSVDVTADGGFTRGGERLPTDSSRRIALLADPAEVFGATVGIMPDAAHFDDGQFVRGNWGLPSVQVTLPDALPTTDLSVSAGPTSPIDRAKCFTT